LIAHQQAKKRYRIAIQLTIIDNHPTNAQFTPTLTSAS